VSGWGGVAGTHVETKEGDDPSNPRKWRADDGLPDIPGGRRGRRGAVVDFAERRRVESQEGDHRTDQSSGSRVVALDAALCSGARGRFVQPVDMCAYSLATVATVATAPPIIRSREDGERAGTRRSDRRFDRGRLHIVHYVGRARGVTVQQMA
jgi:hypothetical protein